MTVLPYRRARRACRAAGLSLALLAAAGAAPARAETGYELWLRYAPLEDASQRAVYRRALAGIVVESQTETARIVRAELQRGLSGLLGGDIPVWTGVQESGAVVAGTASISVTPVVPARADAVTKKHGFSRFA